MRHSTYNQVSLIYCELGRKKTKVYHGKRNFLADAMREMESGEKASNPVSAVGSVPNVIKVVMKPEVPPRRHHHHRHGKRHRENLASFLKLAVRLDKAIKGSHNNKSVQQDNAENALKDTFQFLERVNEQLQNMSQTNTNGERKISSEVTNGSKAKVTKDLVQNDTFPLIPELRSIVVHGKPFDPDATRAAFAKAKQIVWESVGQDPTGTDIGHLNNTKLTNAVALLEMAVREAEKMQRNNTNIVNQGKSASDKIPDTTQLKVPSQRSKQDSHQLKILKRLLLQELKQANYTKDQAGIVISDIPFQKLRGNEQANVMQKLHKPSDNSSLESKPSFSSKSKKPTGGTSALLDKYTSFITNILKAAHLSYVKNLTSDAKNMPAKNSTNLSVNKQTQGNKPVIPTHGIGNISLEESTKGQQINEPQNGKGDQLLSFANAVQEQNHHRQQPQQRFFQPILSKDRLAARKAFGTAQKLVKAFQARQELYKAENDFFKRVHEMLNKKDVSESPAEKQDSTLASQPTVASPIQSPLSQPPVNTANGLTGLGGEGKKETSEAQKKFEEAAHLEEKVAAQQDAMYDALMGHSTRNKGLGGYNEDGAIRGIPEQDDDSYNTEDYGDFKDSDEEAERKFYHDHRQGDFESKAEDDTSFSLRNKITSMTSKGSGSMEFSGNGRGSAHKDTKPTISKLYSSFESSGDHIRNNKLVSKTHKKAIISKPSIAHHLIKTYRKGSRSRRKNISAKRTIIPKIVKKKNPLEKDITATNLRIHVL